MKNIIKNVIIVSPGYGSETTDPGGRDSYELIRFLANKYPEVRFIVITSLETLVTCKNITPVTIKRYDYLYSKLNLHCSKDRKWKYSKFLWKLIFEAFSPLALHNIRRAEKSGERYYFLDYNEFQKWMQKNKKRLINANNSLISFSNPFYAQLFAKALFKEYSIKHWTAVLLDPHCDGICTKNKSRAIEEEKAFLIYAQSCSQLMR